MNRFNDFIWDGTSKCLFPAGILNLLVICQRFMLDPGVNTEQFCNKTFGSIICILNLIYSIFCLVILVCTKSEKIMEDECSVKNNQKASEITVITCALASVMLVSMIVFMDPVCRPSMLVFDVFVTIESMGLILFSSISFFQKKKELVYLDNEKFED